MTTPEGKVKKHLKQRIKALGGEVRFVQWIGRNHAPDTLVLLPDEEPTFIETKKPFEVARAGQEREFKRMRDLNCLVELLDSIEKIDFRYPLR